MALLHRTSEIKSQKATEHGLEVEVAVPYDLAPQLTEFRRK